MTALLIVVQLVTKAAGQFLTGSLVNLILITAGLTGGLACGLTVAALSPILAFFLGIGPAIPHLIPFVILGNLVIVLVYWLVMEKTPLGTIPAWSVGILAGAVAKTLVLWLGIVKLALPLIPGLKPQQIQMMSAMFSWPQLVTALIGGIVAALLVPVLKRAIKS